MKIFFYINILAGGGAERAIVNLSSSFTELGHDVSVVTSYQVDNEYDVKSTVKRFFLEDKKSECGFLSRNLKRISKLRRLLKKENPDILISFMSEPNFRAVVASAFLNVKTIISVRNDPHVEYVGKIKWILAELLFKKADGIVFQTPDAKMAFCRKIRNKSVVIPNMVNPIFYSTPRSTVKDIIITVGRLTAAKNHKLLIRVFNEIKDEIKDCLYIYGEGELREELERIISENNLENRVFLCGNVKNIEEKFAEAKLFVLPSDYEGMPNALMEAMAMGLPCISTDCPCGGPKMIIENGLNGILVPVGDKEKLKQTILILINSDRMLNDYSVSSRVSSQKYKPELIIQKWEKYAKDVVYGKGAQE